MRIFIIQNKKVLKSKDMPLDNVKIGSTLDVNVNKGLSAING